MPLIAVNGDAVNSQTTPNLHILVNCNFLNIWARKMLKIFLKIVLNLYTFLLLEMYIGFRILKTVLECCFWVLSGAFHFTTVNWRFGGKIVLKPPNLWILVSCNFLNIWARKMLKIFLTIALNLYTFLLLEM